MNMKCISMVSTIVLTLMLSISIVSCGGSGSQPDIADVTTTGVSVAAEQSTSTQLAVPSTTITTMQTSEVATDPPTIVNTGIVVEYDTNIMMNQSDVRISIDDSVLGTQAQGEKKLYELALSEGYHDLILSEVGDNTNTNTESIMVSGADNYYYFFIKARNSGYEVEKQDVLTLDEAKGIIGDVPSDSVSSGSDLTTAQDSNGSNAEGEVKTEAPERSTSVETTTEAPVTTTAVIEAVTVDAIDIIEEYSSNELQADAKYKGKVLEVTGVVSSIDTELFDDDKYILDINGGGDFEFLSVSCYDISTDVLSGLTVGSTVTIVGDFSDGGDMGVTMRNCSVK